MTTSHRRVSAPHLARLLGTWRGDGPAYGALAKRVRLLVLDGRLPLATRVPAERELSAVLGVSRTTVAAAYERLRADGFLASRRGAGSWTRLPSGRADAVRGDVLAPVDPGSRAIDLAHAAPAAPVQVLHAAAQAAVAELPVHLPTHGYDARGLPELRAAIATRYTERGLPTTADQVLVTNGAQHALALVLRLLVGAGDRVAVDDPAYPHALEGVRAAGGRLVPVALDRDGWDLEMWASTLRQSAPRLAHVVADYHNPTGLLLDAEGRERLTALARRTRTPLVVDETLVELRIDGPAIPPPVAAFDPSRSVITLGSASKTFWGGLRIGWIRAEPELLARLVAARTGLDLGTPVLEQLMVTRLLEQLDDVLDQRRTALRERRDALEEALARHLPAWRFRRPHGGLVLWAALDAPVSTAVAVAAAGHGLQLAAGPRFGADGLFERFLRLPYTLAPDDLEDAVARLAEVRAQVGPAAVDGLDALGPVA